jgi:hypothetical protein
LRWTVSVPVWGQWHVKTYVERVLWRHVLLGLEDCRYIIHTDRWNEINEAPAMRRLRRFCEVVYRALPQRGTGHELMSACHADAMKDAEAIMFLMPDCMVSVEAFDFVRSCGKKLVVLASLRTLSECKDDIPMHAPELAEWSVANLHPSWKGLIWGGREGAPPTNLYFKSETGFWVHGFHLHPLAAVLDDSQRAVPGSVDGEFVNLFSKEDVYVVTNREVAQCEITSRARGVGEDCWDVSHPGAVASFMQSRANSMHQWFFEHRIMLAGTYNKDGEHVPLAVLDRLKHP